MRPGILVIALAACGSDGSPNSGTFLDDRGFRRSELVASLVNPNNQYSQLRLARYAKPSGGWDALAEWNPRSEPVLAPTTDPFGPLSASATALDVAIDPTDEAALRALGEQAFFHYPTQLVSAASLALAHGGYGVWTDLQRGVGGFQRVELDDGSTGIAATCATCHAQIRNGTLIAGLANEQIDIGRMHVDTADIPPSRMPAFSAWGPGRLDVTTADGIEPVRIPDLRAVQWLTHLQADATVHQRDLTTLAIRLDTLIITSHEERDRPPRIVALALATYLWSLAESLPADAPSGVRGADVFASHCAGCHVPPALTGAPVPLDVVGTDPLLGRSLVRGTGTYRVPSLHGVAQRGLLFHDGAVRSLDALLDPARLSPSYTGGVRPGAVPGHEYGLELDAASRADLLAYLATL